VDILRLHALYVSADRNLCHVTEFLLTVARSQEHSSVMYSASNPKNNNDTIANVFVLQFNGFVTHKLL